MRTAYFRIGVVVAGAGAAAWSAASAGAGIDHIEALVIAEAAVPEGTTIKIQDERFDGENTFEVEMVTDNGNTITEVEMRATNGDITHIKEFDQSSAEAEEWRDVLRLLENANLDFLDAVQRAYSRYPNALIYEVSLNIEQGRLEYDFEMEDGGPIFHIEVDARNANIDDNTGGRSIDVGEAVDIARSDVPAGTVVKVKLLQRNGNWEYKIEVATNNGTRETHLWIDEDNGAIRKRLNRDARPGERDKNQAVMDLWPNAREDFIDAMWLARTELGNARPKLWSFKVIDGRLFFKVKMLEVTENESVLVDARTGNVQ
jgi:uncharacterized membrane protein YkoI